MLAARSLHLDAYVMSGRRTLRLAAEEGHVRQSTHIIVPGLQEAGISVKLAPTIGISVDHRRRNRSLESLQVRPCAELRSLHAGDLCRGMMHTAMSELLLA